MKKGQKRRTWTPKEKAEIVNKHLAEHVSVRTLEKEYHADRSMICRWVLLHYAGGPDCLSPGKERGEKEPFFAFLPLRSPAQPKSSQRVGVVTKFSPDASKTRSCVL